MAGRHQTVSANVTPQSEGHSANIGPRIFRESRVTTEKSALEKGPGEIDAAITVIVREPSLTDAEVARRAGCDRSYLSRNKKHQQHACLPVARYLQDARADEQPVTPGAAAVGYASAYRGGAATKGLREQTIRLLDR